MNKPLWSICLISRNEAKTLPRALESLKDFKARGGEIVVVDTGSADNTAQIARDAGCIVEEVGDRFRKTISAELAEKINKQFVVEGEENVINAEDTIFDFGSARNYAASLATNDMISTMDCDEVFTVLDIDKINDLILKGYMQFEYDFVFSHDNWGNRVMAFVQSKMYNRNKFHWNGIIHEVLSGEGNRCFLGEDTLLLEHWQNFETNRSGYLKGLALDCYEHPASDRNSHYFARECMYTGRNKTAIKEFERHIAMNGWKAERAQSMVFIGECRLRLGDVAGAIKAWQEAFTMDGDRREPLMRLAMYYYAEHDMKKAAAYAAAALEIPEGNFYSDNKSHYRELPHEILYWAEWHLGNREGSKNHLLKALEYAPYNPKYLEDAKFNFEYPGNTIDGFMSFVQLQWLYEHAKEMDSVIEIGSWKGRSTHTLLTGCKGKVIAVDHFKGSDDTRDFTYTLGKQQDIYAQFIENTKEFPNLEVKRMSSEEAVKECGEADMIFIDGEHTYEGVKKDIALWKGKAKKLLCGHDYDPMWPGVIKAVDESFGKPDGVKNFIWWIDLTKRV
jgi:glycosyltransferase involved in cell wall biosynthesis